MTPSWAVLLVKLTDQNVEPFTPTEAELRFTGLGRGTGNLVDYFLDMSHGRLDLSATRVFGWLPSRHSVAERAELWAKYQQEEQRDGTALANIRIRTDVQAWGREAATDQGIDLKGFDGIIVVFSGLVDYFGSYGSVVLQWNAADPTLASIDLTGAAHEWAHGMGFAHSRMEGSGDEYGDDWDIMSAYEVHSWTNGTRYDRIGPGMNAANMAIAGWLDPSRVWTPADNSEQVVWLRPLHRRDLQGYLAIHSGEVYVEFRMNEGWDTAFEEPMVLIHRHGPRPDSLEPCSYLLGKPSGAPWLKAGDAFGGISGKFSPFPAIEVLEIDAEAKIAKILVRPGYRQGPLDSREFVAPFVGPIHGDGGLLFHPRKGLVKVPPRSPLLRMIDQVATLETLSTLEIDSSLRRQALRGKLEEIQRDVASLLAKLDEPGQ